MHKEVFITWMQNLSNHNLAESLGPGLISLGVPIPLEAPCWSRQLASSSTSALPLYKGCYRRVIRWRRIFLLSKELAEGDVIVEYKIMNGTWKANKKWLFLLLPLVLAWGKQVVCSQKIANVLLYSFTEYRLEQAVKLLATEVCVLEVCTDEKKETR